ncbi:unnamed protein product [Diamesa hyperborea]
MENTASKIKKFFAKKKSEANFKLAGPGRKLNSEAPVPSSSKSKRNDYVPPSRSGLSEEMIAAKNAALQRMENKNQKPRNTSLAAIRAQAKREIEEESQSQQPIPVKTVEAVKDEVEDFSVNGVFFTCALISDEILPRKEWKEKIRAFLYEQLEEDTGLTSCLIIKNCNVKDKSELCIETLKKYLENIIQNPENEKFHKIRLSNKAFCDRVSNVEGSMMFLNSAGFEERDIDGELFLSWNNEVGIEMLVQLHEALDLTEIIKIDLCRNTQVKLPSQIRNTNLPPDFYRISPEELKKEQLLRSQIVDNSQILQTKAMREKHEIRMANRYKFSLIRIRFPDGIYLQGTFSVYETMSTVTNFVAESIKNETAEFSLIAPDGHKFTDVELQTTLLNLRLVPNIILNFQYENDSKGLQEYLKEDLLMLVQST